MGIADAGTAMALHSAAPATILMARTFMEYLAAPSMDKSRPVSTLDAGALSFPQYREGLSGRHAHETGLSARVRALWGLSGWRGNERIGKL
jgi:hypothetical protein